MMAYTRRRNSGSPFHTSHTCSRRGAGFIRTSPQKLKAKPKSEVSRRASESKQTLGPARNQKCVNIVTFKETTTNYLTPSQSDHSSSLNGYRGPLEASQEISHSISVTDEELGIPITNGRGEIFGYRKDAALTVPIVMLVDKGKGPVNGSREVDPPREEPQELSEEVKQQDISKLALEISSEPRVLTVEEIASLFKHLQEAISEFSALYFNQSLTAAEIAVFPLESLEETHPALVRLTQYIADGSQYTWRKFLTSPNTRPHLVNGMIAEVLRCHIFDATAFGMTVHHIAQLEKDVDFAYRKYDGFVRTKARAKEFERIFSSKKSMDTKVGMAHASVDACHTLTKQIYTHLLEPLFLPVSVVEKYRLGLIKNLLAIVLHAMGLHQSIRLSGRDGLLLSYRPIPKGTHQYPSKTHPVKRVNEKFLQITRHHARNEDVPAVKLCVFPAVVAYIPTGPTKLEFERNPELSNMLPKLPKELQAPQKARWDIPKKQQKQQQQKCAEPERGSYVTIQLLNVPEVYCEWTPSKADKRFTPNGAADLEKTKGLTLIEATDEAYFELHSGRPRRMGRASCKGGLIAATGFSGAALTAGLVVAAAAAVTAQKSLSPLSGGNGRIFSGLLSQVRLHVSDGSQLSRNEVLSGCGDFLGYVVRAVGELKARRAVARIRSVRALFRRFLREASEFTINKLGSTINKSAVPHPTASMVTSTVLKPTTTGHKIVKKTIKVVRGF